MAVDAKVLAEDTRKQFNILFGNMFTFATEDMDGYMQCYEDVFSQGINFSFMSSTFYAQFSAEILLGMLTSNPFRKYLIQMLDEEKNDVKTPMKYWDESMEEARFGIRNRDYQKDTADILAMMNGSYNKITSLNEWFGTSEGKKEFEMYCLSRKAIKDIKRVICEYPYLIRKYDHDENFAGEIMEYAGIIANQIIQVTGSADDEK